MRRLAFADNMFMLGLIRFCPTPSPWVYQSDRLCLRSERLLAAFLLQPFLAQRVYPPRRTRIRRLLSRLPALRRTSGLGPCVPPMLPARAGLSQDMEVMTSSRLRTTTDVRGRAPARDNGTTRDLDAQSRCMSTRASTTVFLSRSGVGRSFMRQFMWPSGVGPRTMSVISNMNERRTATLATIVIV